MSRCSKPRKRMAPQVGLESPRKRNFSDVQRNGRRVLDGFKQCKTVVMAGGPHSHLVGLVVGTKLGTVRTDPGTPVKIFVPLRG